MWFDAIVPIVLALRTNRYRGDITIFPNIGLIDTLNVVSWQSSLFLFVYPDHAV